MRQLIHRTTALCSSLIAVGLLAACASTAPCPPWNKPALPSPPRRATLP